MQPSYPAHWQITPDHHNAPQLVAWAQTQPMPLGDAPGHPVAGMVREPLHGLQVMELYGHELFRRYFGDLAN